MQSPLLQRFSIVTILVLASAGSAAAQHEHWLPDPLLFAARGRIGIQVQPMTEDLRKYFKAPRDRGLLVSRVEDNRPGARAGLCVGDVIVAAGETRMQEPLDLIRAVAKVPEGQAIEVEVIRDGSVHKMQVYPEGPAAPWLDPEYWSEWLQRNMQQGSEQLRRQLDDMEKRLKDLERRFEQQEQQQQNKQRT